MTSRDDGARLQTSRSSQTVRRSGFTNEEETFKARWLEELDPARPLENRIAAVYEICKEIPLHSVDTLVQLWPVAEDLTREHATIEARKAGFALLKASCSHSGLLQERLTFFQMITTHIHPSEASLQISALDRLTNHGTVLSPIEHEVIQFLISSLESFFLAAQDARKVLASNKGIQTRPSRSPIKATGISGQNEDESSRNPEQGVGHSKLGEERSLIGAFYLVEDIICHNPETFSDHQMEALIDRLTSIARQTTSRKTLHGVVKILRAIATHAQIQSRELMVCLRILCTISKIPKVKFESEVQLCFCDLLQSERQRALKNNLVSVLMDPSVYLEANEKSPESENLLQRLVSSIFTDTLKSGATCCVVIRIFGQLFSEIRLDAGKKDMFEVCLQELCSRLDQEQKFSSLPVDCLAELAATCGPDITNQTFHVLLNLIESKSNISIPDCEISSRLPERTVECLIRLFLRCHPESASKTRRAYKLLLLAAGPYYNTVVRLSVMKLLTRLRCNFKEAIEIILVPDTQGLAGTLCRTEATASSLRVTDSQINRESIQEQPQPGRQGRSSVVDMRKSVRPRSATRSSNFKDQISRPTPPLWIYNDWTKGLPEDPRKGPSQVVFSGPSSSENTAVLDIAPWLDIMIDVLKDGGDWEIYSYVLVHLPSQLTNRTLFARHVGQLQTLHNLVLEQLDKGTFHKPPNHSGMMVGDVALCLYHALTILLSYHELLGRRELDSLVRTFSFGINKWDRPGRCCIHALALCCHEIPSIIDRHIFVIVQKLSQKITQSDLAVDILEFLASLARLPEACSNATARMPETRSTNVKEDGTFFRTIFGICIGYVRSTREQRSSTNTDTQSREHKQSYRQSSASSETRSVPEVRNEYTEYILALAYQVIIFWFLAIDVSQRAQHVGWIAKELAWKEGSGNEVLEEESQVILDMMHRTAFSDLGETEPASRFSGENEHVIKQQWLLGMSVVTVEVSPKSNISQITKRQASGTTHATYHHNTARIPEHHIPYQEKSQSFISEDTYYVLPNHTLLQLTSTIAPVPIPLQPIKLQDDEVVQRALRIFDQTDTVDGHKAGVIYVREGQLSEAEILANASGSDAFEAFLSGLGTRVKLQGALFNTQGLDRESDLDGTHTYAWRDRVTEIVFHVTTMMPTDVKNDPQCDHKKKHIGNDRVKVIFNDSSRPFDFDTFRSEMNEVNIVVSPEAHRARSSKASVRRTLNQKGDTDKIDQSATDLYGFYRVQTLTSSKFPQLSPAASPKVVSAEALPGFVRQLALNSSVFTQVWAELLGQGEYISSWRARLRAIKTLRERFGNTHASANVSYPMPSEDDAPTYIEGDAWNGKLALGGMTEPDQLLRGLDFTRWS